MKVLLINNIFYRKGGSEVVFFNTAELLKKHGHEVVFFSFNRQENIVCLQSKFFPSIGGKLNQLLSYFWNFSAAQQLEKLIETEKPDLAHVHLFWGLMSPSIFGILKKHRVPLVHTAHDYRMVCPAYTFKNSKGFICEKCGGGKFYHCFLNKCAKGSLIQSILMFLEMYFRNTLFHPVSNIDGFIFVSNFSLNKHIQYDKKFLSSNNIVLYNYTYPQIEPTNSKKDYILYFGRLSYEKGIPTLLEAANLLLKINLKVVGTGPIENSLKERYAKSCNTSFNSIDFLGYKEGKELFELVKNAKYVCVPSEWFENNPMTIIESYSVGTPVIGARIGGIPEIVIQGKTGFLFESGSVQSLKNVLSSALSVKEEEYRNMSLSAYEFYIKNFTEEQYYNKLMNFYQTVLNK